MTEGRGAERPRRGRRSSRAPIRAMRPFLESRYRILAVALVLSLAGTGVWLVASVFQIRELGGGPVDLSYVATANAAAGRQYLQTHCFAFPVLGFHRMTPFFQSPVRRSH